MQMLDAVRASLDLSVPGIKKKKPIRDCTAQTLCIRIPALVIFRKAALKGIPDWIVFDKSTHFVYKVSHVLDIIPIQKLPNKQ